MQLHVRHKQFSAYCPVLSGTNACKLIVNGVGDKKPTY